LFDGFSATPTDKSGDRAWITSTSPAGGKAGTGTITFSRTALGAALGVELPPGTPATMYRVGFGLMRTILLADGRVITAEAVVGTDAWFGLGPEPTAPTTTVVAAPSIAVVDAGDERLPIYVGAGAAAVIVLGVLLLLVSRRRRRARGEEDALLVDDGGLDRVPWGRDDGLVTARATAEIEAIRATGTVSAITDTPPAPGSAIDPAATAPKVAAEPAEPTGSAVASPVAPFVDATAVRPEATEATEATEAKEPSEPVAAAETTAVHPEATETRPPTETGATTDATAAAPDASPVAELAERDPMAALAALDLQVSAFRTRLDDLEDESPGGPDGAPPAGS
jgi:hypothetical protein